MGGAGYILYNNIFKINGLTNDINIESHDYDISFSIYERPNNDMLQQIINKVNEIFNDCIKNYKYMNLTKKIFIFESSIMFDRIHIKINCSPEGKYIFHILELSFWLNGKISDNFTINDFKRNNLLLYEIDDIYYYLLPLELLVETTLYAIVDYFEKRNFNKCIKYLNRLKFIKKINDQYMKLTIKLPELSLILKSYKKSIKRKYKMIYDYPYTLSFDFDKIKNNGIVKCIYRKIRDHNRQNIEELIIKYKNDCKDKMSYNDNESEISLLETE